MTRTLPYAVLFLLAIVAPARSVAGQYVFTKIADQSTKTGAIAFGQDPDDGPTINDNGDVVYFVDFGGTSRIVLSSGGVESVLAENVPFEHISPVNNSGTVAVTNWTSLVTIGAFPSSIPAQYDRLLGGVINDYNQVAFRGRFGGSGPEAVYVASGGTVSQIAPNPGVPKAINNSGQVAIYDDFESIVLTDGGPATTIVDAFSNPSISSVTTPLSLNELGQVAFRATASGHALVMGSGGTLTTLVDTSGPFLSVGKPNINDVGGFALTFPP